MCYVQELWLGSGLVLVLVLGLFVKLIKARYAMTRNIIVLSHTRTPSASGSIHQ